MGKRLALMLVLVFLTASCIILDKPVSGASTVGNTWAKRAPMPTARGGLGVATVNGKIYAIGGTDLTQRISGGGYDSGGVVGTNEEYNPTTDTWTTKAPMPTPEAFFAIAVCQNRIYCIGGNNNGFWRVNQVYDPAKDTWKTKAPIPTARSFLQANVLNGKIYCIGGRTTSWVTTGVNEVYDPSTDSWTNKSALPTVTDIYSPSAVFDSKIYVFCGFSLDVNNNFQKTQIYDPETNNWSSGAPPPDSVYGVAVVTVGVMAPKRVYLLSDGGNQIFDPDNNTWMLGANMPTNAQDFGATVVKDTLYVIGGTILTYPIPISAMADITQSADNEQYTPVGYGTPDPSYLLETTPPKINVLSPLNQIYNKSSFSLVFSVDKAVNWMEYDLDGQKNVTITSSKILTNVTIANMTNGLHSITVYANDTYGNVGTSQTIFFTITKPKPFPTTILTAASIILTVALVTGLLVYFKKRKSGTHRKSERETA